jgi:uncharacterized protein with FMN-binding domain
MEHKYRKATLLASVAAVAGVSGVGAIMAEEPAWLPSQSGQLVAGPLDSQGPSRTPLLVANRSVLADGDYTGPAVNAYYGLVQVQVSIQGGRLVSIDVLRYPSDRRTSRYINSQALPMLQREVIQAQNAHVYGVSGATLTSQAYLQSVDAALREAGA